jgi:hypothetical protein
MPDLGVILKSLLAPGKKTIVSSSGVTHVDPREAEQVHSAEVARNGSDQDEYPTLGKDSAPRKRQSAPARPAQLPALTSPDLVISPAFKLIVWLVFALIILSALALVFLALQPVTSSLQMVMNLIGAAFSGAVGALLGLIGGKAIR